MEVISKEKKTIDKILTAEAIDMGGFPVKQALPLKDVQMLDPFLLLHHAKLRFDKNQRAIHQGVGPHPHRGFSPVTFVIKGEIHHRDSRGNDQIAREGEIQWMSAGFGLIHSERPTQKIVDEGIELEIVQLWINTPAEQKMEIPRYQYLTRDEIPHSISADNKIRTSLIAGAWKDLVQDKIHTDSDLLILWVKGELNGQTQYAIPEGYNSMVYVLHGGVEINGQKTYANQLAIMGKAGESIDIKVQDETQFLLFAGKTINERVEQHGPFVMNNRTEILEAMRDYQMGKMGFLVEE